MKISIKTSLLTVFISIVIAISFSLLFSHFYYSKKIALESTSNHFKYLSKEISTFLQNQNRHVNDILSILSIDNELPQTITLSPYQKTFKNFINIMTLESSIHSIYYTDNNSSFYEIINIQESKNYFQPYNLQENTAWIIINIVGEIQQYTYIDKKLNIVGQYKNKNDYHWREREWYIQAIKNKQMIITNPYIFSHLQKEGVTYAKKIEKESVLAIDYTLKSVKERLLAQQFSNSVYEIFILDPNAHLLTTTLDTKQIESPYKIHTLNTIHYMTHNNKGFYEILFQLEGSPNYIGVRIDANKLLQPYIQNFKYSFFIALLLILLSLPIIILSITLIVRPIEKLIVENNKIKNRDFEMVMPIHSHIREFNELSKSLVNMSSSIQKYQTSQAKILDSIIQLIADAIDAKSPYTAGHCRRVPEIAKLLLDEVNKSEKPHFKGFQLTSKDAIKEFEIGAWLHDCGKVTTPEYIVDKSTKLETIYNRIHEIRMRFEVLLRDTLIEELQGNISKTQQEDLAQKLHEEFTFLAEINLGAKPLSHEEHQRILKIAQRTWIKNFDDRAGLSEIELQRFTTPPKPLPSLENLLSDKKEHIVPRKNFNYKEYHKNGFKEKVPKHLYNYGEIYNLSIPYGTLNSEERYKINEHAIMTIKMLEKIPFPENFKKIPEYAGTHHETLIGTGYPRKLTQDELSIPSRIMAIADIFEALSASDRPYKTAKTLSETLEIMVTMVQESHIDKELFQLFLESRVYKKYAEKHLKENQIDEVNINVLLEKLQ